MEQKIKNFDRNIEQIMNETAVAPPFGMWNRISAGLDAEALPIAAATPASFIPKRAVIGLLAGAIILGSSLLTAYLVTYNSNEQNTTAAEVTTTPEVIIPVQVIAEPQHLVAKAMPVAVLTSKKSNASQPVIIKVEPQEVVAAQYQLNNNEVAIPNQLSAQNASSPIDPYYFPPVDVVVPEPNKVVEAPIIEAKLTTPAEAKVVEKKVKPASSSASEKRIKFKKKRSSSFSYGRLNRLKNPK